MSDQPLPRFEFFPVQASVEASRTDLIYYSFVGISVLISLIVVALIVTFSFRYRRGTKAKRGPMPRLLRHEFEAGWVSATFFAFLFMFWWGASNTLSAWLPPEEGLEIHVIGKQWMWKTEHPNGAREINELHVPVGRPVRLVMTSQDVIHDFYVPAFRMKKDVLPGRFTEQGFTATRIGEYRLECAEFCGTQHSHMTGRIIVMRQEDYARWAAAQPQGDDLAQEGAALFRSFGCSGCHAPGSAVHAPNLAGVYGSPVPLSDGRVATADDAYLRDSILQPKKDVAAGYQPIMPSFAGVVGDDDLIRLVAYIKSLKTSQGTAP
jgi:cytochrome c oxidase subunit 2